MKQLTKEQALEFAENGLWRDMSFDQRAKFQIEQDRLCMPFGIFHASLEKALERPVFTHELGLNLDGIKGELFDGKEPPTFEEIVSLIPSEKLAVILVDNERK